MTADDAPIASGVEPPRVLIVDVDVLSTRVMVVALRMRGFPCLGVADAADALKSMENFEPDIVIVEWARRHERRVEEAARIRAHAQACGRPVGLIIVTAECDRPDVDVLSQVDGYFTKPVIVSSLEETIRSFRDRRAR